jgi:hypothetical protein
MAGGMGLRDRGGGNRYWSAAAARFGGVAFAAARGVTARKQPKEQGDNAIGEVNGGPRRGLARNQRSDLKLMGIGRVSGHLGARTETAPALHVLGPFRSNGARAALDGGIRGPRRLLHWGDRCAQPASPIEDALRRCHRPGTAS